MVASFTSSRTAKTINEIANQQGSSQRLYRTVRMLLMAHYSMNYESRYRRLVSGRIKSLTLISLVSTSEKLFSSIEG
jgi:hypothetical protein